MTAHWPTSQESFDIEALACELAVEAFDHTERRAREWLLDSAGDEFISLACAAIIAVSGTYASYLANVVDRLRDRYVAECAHLYRAQAEAERDEYEQAKTESNL